MINWKLCNAHANPIIVDKNMKSWLQIHSSDEFSKWSKIYEKTKSRDVKLERY